MNSNISPEDRRRLQRTRGRAILFLRLCAWVKGLVKALWGIAPILPLCVAFVLVWSNRDKLTPVDSGSSLPTILSYYTVVFLIPAVFALLMAGLLLLLIAPRRTRRYEDALLRIGLTARDGSPPALISCVRIKHADVSVLAFYSLGVSRDTWEQRKSEIEDTLNVHFVDAIRYGGKRDTNRAIIVLTVAPGAGSTGRAGTLYDDEL